MANEITDEQIMAAAYQHLPVWDQDHIRFARAVLALASHTGEAEPVRECGNGECGWKGTTNRMLGSIGPLCPDCGETTEAAATPAAPGEVTEQTLHDIIWSAYEKDSSHARRTVHSSHLNASAPVWFERGYRAALSNPAPVAAPAMPALSCKHSNRSDCGLFGMDEAEPAKSSRPSKEWYAAKIAETLDDDFTIGSEAMPIAAPAPASEAVAVEALMYCMIENGFLPDNPDYDADMARAKIVAEWIAKRATPSAGDSADATVQQAGEALKWCAAALQALVDSRGERGSISMFVSGEKKSLEEVLDIADDALKTAQTTALPGDKEAA
jgi:hypothetical protein